MFVLMTNPYERKKQPELVRQALLDCAARISAENGLGAITIQAVADAAGVTKGGLLHHYPSKQALIDAVFDEVVARLDENIDTSMAKGDGGYGAFTRAYVDLSLLRNLGPAEDPWAAMSIFMLSDPAHRCRWKAWIVGRLEQHRDTDGDHALQVVRFAADGIWLARLLYPEVVNDQAGLRADLMRLADEIARR